MAIRTPTRVVVVEDSALQRAHLVSVLERDADVCVVGQASDASDAITVIERERPDLVTLDLVIPEGGGMRVIEHVMASMPTPILVLSATVTSRESVPAIEALVAGATDALPKPSRWTPAYEDELRRAARAVRGVAVVRHPRGTLAPRRGLADTPRTSRTPRRGRHVVAIAASTGGPPALARVLGDLDGLAAPVLVVQHIHPEFVEGLATWMRQVSPLPVRVARSGEPAEPGTVYIGPGNVHLRLAVGGRVELSPDPPSIHCPSADELFRSVAEHAGADGIGVVLTGMGSDGATGLAELRRRGGLTIAQDEASSAVFGMPRAAMRLGAVDSVLPLTEIAGAVLAVARRALR